MVLAVLVADMARLTAARAQLTVAADAAALAAAPATFSSFGSSGRPAAEAEAMATANGATLAQCRCPIDRSWADRTVVVVVTTVVDLTVLGSRRLETAAAAEFRPVELAERPG
jgi:hypothetical protein